jgi:Zn-dependent membrane protease YugP
MHFVLLGIIIVAIVFGPQLWARRTFKKYSYHIDAIPGTGGELAKHLVEKLELPNVTVETTEQGDHYDPQSRTVRLSSTNFNGKSLTAVAVAAHEVGHAMQHAQNSAMLNTRTRLVRLSLWAQRLGSVMMFAIPIVMTVTRAPSAGLLMGIAAIATMFLSTIVHLVTLPVEWDASFGKALPVLQQGGYIHPRDENIIRKILKAAALTYVASSLASLLNLWRWLRVLRRH